MPIGNDNNKQVALSISNINRNNNLMVQLFLEKGQKTKKKFSFLMELP